MIALVEVLKHKCLCYVRVPVGEFQILVGQNAMGKSAFMDALPFLRRGVKRYILSITELDKTVTIILPKM